MTPNLNNAPRLALDVLWHVGTLNPSDKGRTSQEGNGLSVSLHPEAWTFIARLGGGRRFRLTRPGGAFLDFHQLGEAARSELLQWGLKQSWLQLETRWALDWVDSEQDSIRRMLLGSAEEAACELQEVEDQEGRVTEVTVPCLTDAAFERIGFPLDPLLALDMAATFWVEDATDLDGVWWDDVLDIHGLSAPRGVICRRQLPNWTVSPAR